MDMKHKALAILIIVILLVLSISIPIHATQETQLRLRSIDKSRFPKVGMTVFVSSPEQLDKTIYRDNLTVTENGRKQEILKVEAIGVKPMTVVLAIDTSGSMAGQPIAAAKAAAKAFIQSMKPEHQLAIVRFDTTPAVVTLPTSDKNQLNAAIDGLDASTGDTAMYDGVVAALELCAKSGTSQQNIIVMSDGADNKSTQTLENVLNRAKQQGVAIFGVGLVSPDYSASALQTITSDSNGKLVTTSDPQTLSSLYKSLAAELNQQYWIEYVSKAGPETKNLAIKVTAMIDMERVTLGYKIPNPFYNSTAAELSRSNDKIASSRILSEVAAVPFWFPIMLLLLFVSVLAFVFSSLSVFVKSRNPVKKALTPYEKVKNNRRTIPIKRYDQKTTNKMSTEDERRLLQEAIKMTNSLAARRGLIETIQILLIRAGIPLKPAEFIFFHVVTVVGISLVTQFVLRNMVVTIAVIALVTALPLIYVYYVGNRRRKALHDQLPDLLMIISGSLKAGYGLLQAFRVASEEMSPPASLELKKVLAEANLGLPIEQALDAMAARLASETLTWVVAAIKMHIETGGNLAEILESIAATARERDRIDRQIEVLTAEGKLSAVILFILPIAITGIMFVLNPSYVALLFTTTAGLVMVGVAVLLMLIGAVWFSKVVSIEV